MQAQLRNMRAPATHMPVRVSSSRPVGAVALPVVRPAAPMGLRRTLPIVCSSGVAHPGEEASGRGFADGDASFFVNASVPHVTMARGGGQNYGSGGSLGAVMERSKLQFVMPTPPQQGPKLDDSGSGGDNGKNLHNGGGGGGGDDDDDDDYFGEDDGEGGEGNGGEPWRGPNWFRTAVPELFDRLSIAAVLQEWHKTIIDLPLFIRRAVEMGLFSSAQLVRFLSVDVRPNITRTVSRALPTEWAREFVGRLMADPGFCQKLVLEQCMAAGFSLFHEWRTRGDKFKDELDLVAINTMGMMAATAACVWVTAPSRSYGAVHKFPWQQMLAQLPSSVFDASGPLRQYSAGTRVAGLFSTGVQLSAVGALAGAATAAASQAAVALRQRSQPEWAPSVPVPDVARSSGGLAAFFAVNANLRYQLMGGVDRYLFSHASALWGYMLLTGAARVGSQYVGELSRPAWQGLATETAPRTRVRRVRRRKAAAVADKPAAAPAPEVSTSGLVAATAAAAAVAGEQAASTSGAAPAVVASSTSGVDAASAEAAAVAAGEAEAQAAASSGVAEAEDALLSSGGAVMASPDQLQQLLTEQQEQRAAAERQLSGVVGAAATSALTQAATQAVA